MSTILTLCRSPTSFYGLNLLTKVAGPAKNGLRPAAVSSLGGNARCSRGDFQTVSQQGLRFKEIGDHRFKLSKTAAFSSVPNTKGDDTTTSEMITLYTKSHEYIRYGSATAATNKSKGESSSTTIELGVTEHAIHHLDEVIYCTLPAVGTEVAADEEACALESVKAVGSVYTPVDGSIEAVNPIIGAGGPEGLQQLNSDPEGKDGWLVRIKVTQNNRPQLSPEGNTRLLSRSRYDKVCEEENKASGGDSEH